MTDMRADIEETAKALAGATGLAVISHVRADGDAIGSTLALGLALRGLGKKVKFWNGDKVPAVYGFLQGADEIEPPPDAWDAELQAMVCVDCGDPKRLGTGGRSLLGQAPVTLNIDHHETNARYARVNCVCGGAAACAGVIARVLDEMKVPLTRPVAEALYVGLSTDTGSFRYACTTPQDMRLGARLLEAGADAGDICRRLYQEESAGALAVKCDVLNRMVTECDGQLVHCTLTAARRRELGVSDEETRDMVKTICVLAGTRIAIIFEELEAGCLRVSLRSKDPRISVSTLAARFGGGGHARAAGIRMRGDRKECRARVLEAARETLARLYDDTTNGCGAERRAARG